MSSRPEVLANKISLSFSVYPSNVDGTFPFGVPDYLGNSILWWIAYQHVHTIHHNEYHMVLTRPFGVT